MMRSWLVFILVLSTTRAAVAADDDLASREQQAFQAAVARVAPSVVRIETVGGRERLGKVLLGAGPTTGLIVRRDGLIVSSAFNFLSRPDSILVHLPDSTRKPARLLATDRSRMVSLLAVKPDTPLPVPEMAPRGEIRVGQWAVAMGRTFEVDRPNLSVGIVSATSRIGGRAIQTDAAASPNNYGGPLVDIRGRVLGVLTPLSPNPDEKLSGIEWYDSGIGFAVPVEDILRVVPRLERGENLHAGHLGVAFAGLDPNTSVPIVAACHPRSPAFKVLKPGDRVTAIDAVPVARVAELEDALARHYAGDRVTLTIDRDTKQQEVPLTLIPELPPLPKKPASRQIAPR